MIAHVVPITRIRRDTTWWSYKVPAKIICQAGSLVIIPFRGRECLGVVWHIEEKDEKAAKNISQVITAQPLVRAPQRAFIEYLSQCGLCSLSTALYIWLPSGLRSLPLSREATRLLSEYTPTTTSTPQHAILVPGFRPEQSKLMARKFGNRFQELFSSDNLAEWFAVARGDIQVGIGRERALFSPWLAIKKLTVIEPEDIAYYHEQIPYIPMVEAAQALAGSQFNVKSYLPTDISQELWGPTASGASFDQPVELIDQRQLPLIHPDLVERIRSTLPKTVLILLNAYDRSSLIVRDGRPEKVVIPGIETVRKRLAHLLGFEQLPSSIILGTRKELHKHYSNVGLTVALSIDPLLQQTTFADILHGVADIGHLQSYTAPCVIQTRDTAHPLVQALAHGTLSGYLQNLIDQQKAAHLPPFGQYIVCSHPMNDEEKVTETFQKLEKLISEPWQLSHPFTAKWRKTEYQHILLHAQDTTTRLPIILRRALVELPRPWKVQYNPWYLL